MRLHAARRRPLCHLPILALLGAAGLAAGPAARAEEPPAVKAVSSNQVVVYKPDYFTPFQVLTAWDMVSHIPGFGFNSGGSARGFAGTAGNVLIDGQRPATKGDLGALLGNIPASQVDHIELIIGGAPGIDMQGYSQIVNVVRKANAAPSLTLETAAKMFHGGRNMADFSAVYSANRDGRQTDISYAVYGYDDHGAHRERRLTWTPDREHDMTPRAITILPVAGGIGSDFKASHSRPLWGGRLSLNGAYSPSDYDYKADYVGDTTASERSWSREIASEVGVQYEHALNAGLSYDLNGLNRHDRVRQDDRYQGTGVSHFQSLALTDEHILSGRLTWQPNDRLTFKLGGEHALNSLDNLSSYTQNDTSQTVPFDKVRVEEDRTEYLALANWQVRPKLDIDASLTVESSTISVKQDQRSQSFVFTKPKILVVWTPTAAAKVSWRTEFYVGQLDFNDFASAVSLETAVIKAGNPGIVPMTAWQNQITFDYTFWTKGALELSYEHADIQNVLDYAPITTDDGIFDARGNIGDGTRDSLNTSLTLPLDRFHITGGEFKFDTSRNLTRAVDPVTHLSRTISGRQAYTYNFSFNQNLATLHASWGMELSSVNDSWQFHATELYHLHSAPSFSIYADYKAPGRITYSLAVRNPQKRHEESDRYAWTGLRGDSALALQQHSEGDSPGWIVLRVRKEM
ncbi:MAG: hypothetical protein JF615_00355 [Asticcacaulis sp.]|nr:hypothetical protein [Asticcacaulis sp.]